MKDNGLELSNEKTNMMLFNNGFTPRKMPKIYIDKNEIKYVQEVKFLGVFLTVKLSWKKHIEYLIQKAIKSFYLIKIISRYSWGQDSQTLIHLACALVRSKLSYGQEVYFSAPKTYLKKLSSLDSKSIKIALGVPIHTKTLKAYSTAGILPLDDWRKLSCAKYIIRAKAVTNFTNDELNIRSDITFPRRARKVKGFETIASYVRDVFEDCQVIPDTVTKKVITSPTPMWELEKANFDYNYTDHKKTDGKSIVAVDARIRLQEKYHSHLNVYTDGSVLSSGETGAAFVIPDLKVSESFHLGKGISVFTAELTAVLMALYRILDLNINFFNIVFCVDSKSVLQALDSFNCKERIDIIIEIRHLIHSLIVNGTYISFCWIPSHSGFFYNDLVDQTAKRGALNLQAVTIDLSLSVSEMNSIIKNKFKSKFTFNCHFHDHCGISRSLVGLAYRIYLNSIRTKYCVNVKCVCNEHISIKHLLSECNIIRLLLPENLLHLSGDSLTFEESLNLAKVLIFSPVGQYL